MKRELAREAEASAAGETAPSSGIPGARPGAYTEMIVTLRVQGVSAEASADLEVSYADALLGPPRVVAKDSAWRLEPAGAGRLHLRRGGTLKAAPSEPPAVDPGAMPLCGDPEQGEWVGRLGFPVKAPQETSPESLSVGLHLRTVDAGAEQPEACVLRAVFRTRGLLAPGRL